MQLESVPSNKRQRVVVALGGNALIRREQKADFEVQRHNVETAARAIADISHSCDVVITHGNGPQVGLLALQNAAYPDVSPYPLDALGAETQGMIGYLIEQSVGSYLPSKQVVALLTQVVVDRWDPAFKHPTKFVGPAYEEEVARSLAESRGWVVKADGRWFRRVVASPEPKRIVEFSTIRLLVESGVIVICSGGGGIPVFERGRGLEGAEAVVDKDLTASLLATQLDADILLLLTDVRAVQRGFGSAAAEDVRTATPSALRSLGLPAGSMGPKAEAACRFVEATGRRAAIGALDDALGMVAGDLGTQVYPEKEPAFSLT